MSRRAGLASLGELRDLAGRVAAEHPRVGVLVSNAGIGYASNGDTAGWEAETGTSSSSPSTTSPDTC